MTNGKKKKQKQSSSRKSAADWFDDPVLDTGVAEGSEASVADLRNRIRKLEATKSAFESLLNISASINSTFNQRDLLKKIVDAVIRTTDCDRGFLMLKNPSGEYSFNISRSKDEKELDEGAFEVSRSVVEEAAESGEPVPLWNIQDSELFKKKKSVVALRLGAAYAVPLKYEDKLTGIIYVDSERTSERFTKDDLPVLKSFGAQAAVAIENARRRDELESSFRNLKRRLEGRFEYSGIIGKSEKMREVIETVQKVAPLPGTVFIHGESGVGKELVARAIHHNSPRKNNRFFGINCGAIPDTLLETTLFGAKKGSYTSLERDTEGAFETTDRGTLFLDEITETSRKLQTSLLRVLQENEFNRVGDTETRKVDVRVIAATNKDLKKEMDAGRFRSDLFYRLYVLTIHVPPLRERPDDIPVLAEHFIGEFSDLLGIERPTLGEDAVKLLLAREWPGNVRELQNLMVRTLSLDGKSEKIDAKIIKKHLEPVDAGLLASRGETLKDKVEYLEAEIIRQVLALHGGNVTRAAEELKISRQVLYNKMNKYKLTGKS
jgi:transcriptional regulator with GAF, ATPase, and Fis domain